MAKSANQKTKLLRLWQLLLRQTDEDHPITVAQIIEELARYDIKAERKSIYFVHLSRTVTLCNDRKLNAFTKCCEVCY